MESVNYEYFDSENDYSKILMQPNIDHLTFQEEILVNMLF